MGIALTGMTLGGTAGPALPVAPPVMGIGTSASDRDEGVEARDAGEAAVEAGGGESGGGKGGRAVGSGGGALNGSGSGKGGLGAAAIGICTTGAGAETAPMAALCCKASWIRVKVSQTRSMARPV